MRNTLTLQRRLRQMTAQSVERARAAFDGDELVWGIGSMARPQLGKPQREVAHVSAEVDDQWRFRLPGERGLDGSVILAVDEYLVVDRPVRRAGNRHGGAARQRVLELAAGPAGKLS